MKIDLSLLYWKDCSDNIGKFCVKRIKNNKESFIYITPLDFYIINFYGELEYLCDIWYKFNEISLVKDYSLDQMKDKLDYFLLNYEKLLAFL